MELKFSIKQMHFLNICCSNCTFMELKFQYVWFALLELIVLIVPLWN